MMQNMIELLTLGSVLCVYIMGTHSYAVLTQYDKNGEVVPNFVCERSIATVAAVCQHGQSTLDQPKWLKWTRDGQEIQINTKKSSTYISISDGGRHFYLIFITPVGLENDEDRYACCDDGVDSYRQLKQSSAIIRVLPRKQCQDSNTTPALLTTKQTQPQTRAPTTTTTTQSLSTSSDPGETTSARLEEKKATTSGHTSVYFQTTQEFVVGAEMRDNVKIDDGQTATHRTYALAIVLICILCFILLAALLYQCWNSRKSPKLVPLPAEDKESDNMALESDKGTTENDKMITEGSDTIEDEDKTDLETETMVGDNVEAYMLTPCNEDSSCL